ncbi:hypothetical protein [Kordiimonas sp. SCSIO 12610]|uniref:hypothetical protein n=1 Tax=Kordiimonas sp. SCSIO 12610 TaxID=2829597 RepID=UPI00210964FF|nr:hypothetical protein [Kordiimonas sp. SCSIO 12610]UTW55375.1 hypothetical protein KFF44_00335 [Kordiimonas sp. SCSIO 12610]
MDITLILSLLILLVAPLLARLASRAPRLKVGFDGFVMIIVLGLITLTLLPEALAHGGLLALFIAVSGFIMPWIAEKLFHKTEEMTHRILLVIASFALVIHAASDGAILAFASDDLNGYFLAAGILLHRFGVAISVWWLLRPVLSSAGGYVVLISLGVMTLIGYFLAAFAGDWYNIPLAGYWQAFAAGSLLHVVMHPIGEDQHTKDVTTETQTNLPQQLGTAIGVLFIIALIIAHYLHHTPVTAPQGHDHTSGRHAIDMMMASGLLIGPILILMLLTSAAIARSKGTSWRNAIEGAERAAPWSLLSWLIVSCFTAIWPDILPMTEKGHVIFFSWLAIVTLITINMGARAFFRPLLPKWLVHQHSHSH